jgi:hypothetical protein
MTDPMGDTPEIVRAPAKAKPKPGKKRPATVAKPQVRPQAQSQAAPTRANPRPVPPRPEAARELARENPREGAMVAVGRDGERLTRRRIATGDPLDVPLNEIPQGWSYQWNPVTVLNKGIEEILQGDLQMYQNGWRPVPASRHPGRWTPVGFDGQIVVQGLRLEERPMSLTLEAKAEDEAHARAQVRDRTDALRLTQKQLPGARVAAARGQAGGLKMDIDFGADIPRPGHIAEGDPGYSEE